MAGWTLDWEISPNSAALVVDVQRDFCPGGALPVPDGHKVIGVCNYMMQALPLAFATRDWHPFHTRHFDKWSPHCRAHTVGAEFAPGLYLPNHTVIIYKGTGSLQDGYSGFMGDDFRGEPLNQCLRVNGVDKLYVMGLATDYCVKATVLDALAAGFEVEVILDGIAAVNLQPNDGALAIQAMGDAGATFNYSASYGYPDGLIRL